MESQLVVINLNARKGVEVKGKVHVDAKRFALNLGADDSNLMIHFNPRFESEGDRRTIVCNSMQDRKWGEQQRDEQFPFKQGEDATIWSIFDDEIVTVKASKEHEIKFPNRLGLGRIEFLSVDGDFKVQFIKID